MVWMTGECQYPGGALCHVKGKVYRAGVQTILTYGAETWARKAENLRILERTCRAYDDEMDVSLRKCSVWICIVIWEFLGWLMWW